jgi:hypothetical protein
MDVVWVGERSPYTTSQRTFFVLDCVGAERSRKVFGSGESSWNGEEFFACVDCVVFVIP